MAELLLKPGSEVSYQGTLYQIQAPIDLEHVILEDPATHEKTTAKISDLKLAKTHTKQNARENMTDLMLIAEHDWEEAKRREAVLASLADKTKCSLDEAKQAAKQLGVSWRQIYNLLKQYRDYDHQLLALIPGKSTGGKGKPRITFITEKIIQDVVTNRYLSPQKN